MRTILVVMALILSRNGYAQVHISAGTGIGWFSMKEFHDFQEHLRSSFPVAARITEQFPAYVIYDASIAWQLRRTGFLGVYYQYGSTGGRIHYKDYSGEIYSDQLFHYNTIALNAGEALEFGKNYSLRVDLHPGATFTSLELLSVTKIGDQRYQESYKFHSINATMQPTFELTKTWGNFGLKLSAGYHIAVYAGKVKLKGNKNAILLGSSTDPIAASWDGLRLGLSGIYIIGRRLGEEE